MNFGDETSIFAEDANILDVYTDLFLAMSRRVNKQIILKGNVLLNKLLPHEARLTKDLDVSIVDRELFDIIKDELKNFSENLIKLGIAASYHIRDIASHSGGLDVFNEAGDKLYSVDVNLCNVSVYGFVEYSMLGESIYGASVEKILCDKCISILSKRRFKRIKDFYDVFIILDSGLKFSYEKILELMLADFSDDASLEKQLDGFPFDTNSILALRNLWNAEEFKSFAPDITLGVVEFSTVITSVYRALEQIKVLYWNKRRKEDV